MFPRLALLASLVCLAFGWPSGAAAEEAGRVVGLYHEAARGVLLESRFAAPAGARRWADVQLAERRVLVQLPEELEPRLGDHVAVRLAEPRGSALARALPMATVARALRIEPQASRIAERGETAR